MLPSAAPSRGLTQPVLLRQVQWVVQMSTDKLDELAREFLKRRLWLWLQRARRALHLER